MKTNMTHEQDVWTCHECGEMKGRHDQGFDGDLCEKCNTFNEEVKADKIFRASMKQQIIEQAQRDYGIKL